MSKKKILFKVDGKVVCTESDTQIDQVEIMKHIIAEEENCDFNDIDVEIVDDLDVEMSDLDVCSEGLYNWMHTQGRMIHSVECILKPGSDAYLDAISKGTITDYLFLI